MKPDDSEAPITAPEESGADMAQERASVDKFALTVQPRPSGSGLKSASLADVLQSTANQGPRRPSLIAPDIQFLDYAIRQTEDRLKKEQDDHATTLAKLEIERDDHHQECLKNENLKGQLRTISKVKKLQTCMQTAGGLILGVSIKSDLTTALPRCGIIVGVLLVVGGLGWFNGYNEKEVK